MLVIASDGVFEFLTNQSVIDMCLKFQDPLSACRAVVAESYELWLQYELRTDDITMIAIYIDEADKATEMDKSATNLNDIYVEGVKPVRRTLSRQKKNAMMKARSAKEVRIRTTVLRERSDQEPLRKYRECPHVLCFLLPQILILTQ